MGVSLVCTNLWKTLVILRINMETRNELGLIGTIEDSDVEEANAIEEDSDEEVILLLLHVCTWKHFETEGITDDSQPFRSRANSLPGANRPIGPWPIRSLELSFLGPFTPWPFRSLAFSLPGTFAPRSEMALELSFPGTFTLRSIRSQEHSLPGTFVPC